MDLIFHSSAAVRYLLSSSGPIINRRRRRRVSVPARSRGTLAKRTTLFAVFSLMRARHLGGLIYLTFFPAAPVQSKHPCANARTHARTHASTRRASGSFSRTFRPDRKRPANGARRFRSAIRLPARPFFFRPANTVCTHRARSTNVEEALQLFLSVSRAK